VYEFSTDWFSHAVPMWIRTFSTLKLNLKERLRVLEVGSFEGRSSCWISDHLLAHPESVLVCIDTFEGSTEHAEVGALYEKFIRNIGQSKNSNKVQIRRGRSHAMLESLMKERLVFDLVYIDGSHETEDVLADGKAGFALLRDNGVLIFDDYAWVHPERKTQSVKEAIDVLEKELSMSVVCSGWQRSYVKSAPPI
jgi:predicted O-methyltransferase YrrM